jgi:hypothetical protein
MARFREYSYDQAVMLPVALGRQLQPGSFEHAINHLVDHCVDRTVFDERYANDDTSAPAIDPAILLKIVLFAYSRGILSSRAIARACEENVIFLALSAVLDTERGRHYYSRRMGIVEPVFGNTRATLGMDRFTLRGHSKVDAQWKLSCARA